MIYCSDFQKRSISKCLIGCIALLYLLTPNLSAQIERVEPPNWWVGMSNSRLQLLVKGKGITNLKPIIEYKGVKIEKISKANSPNYLFIDLSIASDTKSGSFEIVFWNENQEVESYTYSLNPRATNASEIEGFNSSDVIYLITPDRFANGNTNNDTNAALKEASIDRKKDYARHGGDIRGMIDHLDYLDELGVTSIWSSPLLENDMPQWSYHGYAITDYYKVDPRFGSLQDYKELADKAREKGIKLIMDGVVNHCGSHHWWMKDLPFEDWLNYQNSKKVQVTNHRRTVNQDLYASKADQKLMNGGWFVPQMPDLNQKNPFMATYLIQSSIWWIETLGLGGIRQDTYPYPDKEFLTNWTCQIMNEYPNFSIVGEEWSYNPLLVAYWQRGNKNKDGYESCLRSTMDFPMQRTLVEALREEESWDKGLIKLYEGLANDFVYPHPQDLLVFGDNHDMDRLYTQLGENLPLMKMAIAYLLTMRGIPQIYYGTEVLIENSAKPGDHGLIRTDFPGGWKGDKVNTFTGKGLSSKQVDMLTYTKNLLQWRKKSEVIHHGKTIHFTPQDGVYVYFRYNEEKKVMVVLNKNSKKVSLTLNRFAEMLAGHSEALNIVTKKKITLGEVLPISAQSALVLELE